MPQFMIEWDMGFGPTSKIVKAKSKKDAIELAYNMALEESIDNFILSAEIFTKERAEELGYDWEEYK